MNEPKTVRVYNTLSRRLEPLETRQDGQVTMYVCGPTVYNYVHIGNARTFVSFDTVRRYLAWRGYEVRLTQNITDIDDKIIQKAQEEGTTPEVVAKEYLDAFHEDMDALGVDRPDVAPLATQEIPSMISLVEQLYDRGIAYEKAGNVYFSVRKFEDYGRLSGRSFDDMKAGERVEPDPNKEDPLDFALWKASKPDEPYWESPWGHGRPGWHLECSAMSAKYLGTDFDIHGGAQDLIFPHHENEIAQTESATGERFARYWLHAGLLNIGREKMSKSVGNVLLLRDFLKVHSPKVFRMMTLSTHYRSPMDFGDDTISQAKGSLNRLVRALENLEFAAGQAGDGEPQATKALAGHTSAAREDFTAAMDDDFNTARALSAVFGLVREANTIVEGSENLPSRAGLDSARTTVLELMNVLGIDLQEERGPQRRPDDASNLSQLAGRFLEPGEIDVDHDKIITALLARREEARSSGDFSVADGIRDGLLEVGIEIEDTPQGPRPKRRST